MIQKKAAKWLYERGRDRALVEVLSSMLDLLYVNEEELFNEFVKKMALMEFTNEKQKKN